MSNEDGTVWTVFNGEIYNHGELQAELEQSGHSFRGRADTEVIPHLYEEYGPEFVSRLRGMFALALYDSRAGRLILARDRFGIKPLYVAASPGRLAFSSELAALRLFPGVDLRPDLQAIHDFSALLYIPAPLTFYTGIRTLEPGVMIEARLDGGKLVWGQRRFYDWALSPDSSLRYSAAVEQAGGLIRRAVSRQLESEVPLASLLSGGIDSSLVASAAQEACPAGIDTFNVRFSEAAYDETPVAEAVATHIGSRHHTLEMDRVLGTWEHIASLLSSVGQPYADTSLFAAHAVCRLVKDHATVLLGGDGGDEGFGGYRSYLTISRILQLQKLPSPLRAGVFSATAAMTAQGLLPAQLHARMGELSRADSTAILQTLYSWVREQEHAELFPHRGLLPVRRHFEAQWRYALPGSATALDRLSAQLTEVNVRLTLPNDYLFKVDAASMRESVEVRVPMLDEDLFEFALTLPHRLKVARSEGKRVLRGVCAKRLPNVIADRPKRGFMVPVDRWVSDDFKRRLKAELVDGPTALKDLFRLEAYKPVVEAFCTDRPLLGISRAGVYQRAIMFLALHLALE